VAGVGKEEAMKLLVAVGDVVETVEALPSSVSVLLGAASEALVMSPSHVTRLEWLTGGVDNARRVADERLGTVLGQMEDVGVEAQGIVGDELLGLAFSDALRDFAADHILIGLRRVDRARFRRQQVVDRLLERFDLPITVFLVGG
jgi:hypothetical protein